MLVDTPEGIVNTDHIVSIVPSRTYVHDGRGTITFADGSTRQTRNVVLLEKVCGTIVPAQSGFDLVSAILPDKDEAGVVYSVQSVIAFRIGAGAGAYEPVPITLSGEPGTDPGVIWTVRQPSGICIGPDTEHDDLDAFKADCERTAAQRRMAAE